MFVSVQLDKQVDTPIHMPSPRAFAPGNSLADPTRSDYTNNTGQVNEIVYTNFEPNDVPLSIKSQLQDKPSFTVSGNYPHPATDLTQISIQLDKVSNLTVEVVDIMGKVIYTEEKAKLAPGSHQVTFQVSSLAAGLYTYSVTDGAHTINKKMMVQ